MSDARARMPNYLFIKPEDLNRYIYRIISIARLEELFTQRQNVLVRPSMWEDPFENFVLNSPAILHDGTQVTFEFNNDFFGQCWTLKSTSDAMWRIYSPQRNAVRIRTTIQKLADSLSAELGEWAHEQAFIGKVQYCKLNELREFGNRILANGLRSTALAQTLLIKRRAFAHESEVRLLYFEKKSNSQNGLHAYGVDPHALIDQIMIDPRIPVDEVESFMRNIRDRTGFEGRLLRSLLYAPPRRLVFRIGI